MIMNIFRWILAFPGAAFGSLAMYWLIKTIDEAILSLFGLDPKSLIWAVPIELSCGFLLGIAFVKFAVKTAPSHKRVVAFSALGIMIFICGGLVLAAVFTKQYMAILSNAGIIYGSVCVAYMEPLTAAPRSSR
jgi:hypothetical protein